MGGLRDRMGLKVGFLFPGQGAQYVGMGYSFYEKFEKAKQIFEQADQILGFKISKLCFEGPLEKLTETINCQIAVFIHSVASFEVFKESFQIQPQFLAGLSLGEYTCLYAAEVLGFKETLLLVKKRAELMQKCSEEIDGGMCSIIGLDLEKVEEICRKCGCQIANLNSPVQIVVSGEKERVLEAKELAEQLGAKAIVLNVGGAFHSSLMKPAREALAEYLEGIEFKDAKIPIVSNVIANSIYEAKKLKENLIEQMTQRVLWQRCCEYITSQGVKLYFELGPGKVLRNLFRKIDSSCKVLTFGKEQDLEKVKKEVEL